MKITPEKIEELKVTLIGKKKHLLEMIASIEAEDPFKDPEAANRSPSADTDIREEQGFLNVQAQLKELKSQLSEVESALDKTMGSNYGICENCSQDIPESRLTLVPWARYCIDCDKQIVR